MKKILVNNKGDIFTAEVSDTELEKDVFDVDFQGHYLLQITRIDAELHVTNGLNGYGQNVQLDFEDAVVKIHP